ncbi:porin family protein [Simiduia sp. 21SJ11W-1]|uniref:porin family protein n=1 Tax=Simiduia sp. 21SJ11W-1 TaxID=2909669 RepID=UPI00209E9149|nr:porin family protein [Simiduia sp. 21SJ11W-1]UTA47668.1 porin family protein [Simiduia sp. 21SJ11W-1]
MKTLFTAATTLVLCGLTQSALAASDAGLYLGGSIGNAQMDFDSFDNLVDDNDTGYKIFGGYNFGFLPGISLGIETGFTDFGSVEGELQGLPARFDNTAWQAHLVGGLDLGPLGIFAKAGVNHWQTKFQYGSFSDKNTGSDPAYGIGATLEVDALQLRAEYEQLDFEDAKMDFYSVGASFRF